MTSIILIAGLVVALSASLARNWLQGRAYENLKRRYTQLYEQTEIIATDVNPTMRWIEHDPDDYSDLTSAQRVKTGGRS